MTTAIGAAFLLHGAFSVTVAALHAGRREAAGPLRRRTMALLHRQHRPQELAARCTLPVVLGERPLIQWAGDRLI